MKIKNKIYSIMALGALLFSSNLVMGQSLTGQTTLKVTLQQVQSIIVNDAEVELNYATAEDYTNGVSVDKADHITVNSSDDFKIQVKTSSENLQGSSSSDAIAANSILITPEDGTSSPATNGNYTPVNLSTTDATTITANAGMGKTFDMKYTGAKDDAYAGLAPDTYSTTVTYTLSAQ